MTPYADDIELATSVLRGESRAVTRLFSQYCAPAVQYHVLTKAWHCHDCLDEVMQAVCIEVFHAGDWRPVRHWVESAAKRASLKTYLRTVVIRTANRRCRRCRKDPTSIATTCDRGLDLPDNGESALAAALGCEIRSALLAAVGRLESPAQRVVILSYFFRGRTIREIAAATGESENNISQLKLRALACLREILDSNAVSRD